VGKREDIFFPGLQMRRKAVDLRREALFFPRACVRGEGIVLSPFLRADGERRKRNGVKGE